MRQIRSTIAVIRYTRGLALAALTLFAAGPAAAQSPALGQTHATVQALFQQGLYDDAPPHAEAAVRLSAGELGSDHPTTAALLFNLAEICRLRGASTTPATAMARRSPSRKRRSAASTRTWRAP